MPESGTGTIDITAVPAGADIYTNDQFYGNGPATLKLKPGKHMIRVKNARVHGLVNRDYDCLRIGGKPHGKSGKPNILSVTGG